MELSDPQVINTITQNWPELIWATGSIGGITYGSAKFGEINPEMTGKEIDKIKQIGSGCIAAGGAGMLALAFYAGEPTFSHPEIVLLAGSTLQFLRNLSHKIDEISTTVRARIGVMIASGIMCAHTVLSYSHDWVSVLPPLGLTALTIAYSIGGDAACKKLYRKLTTSGGLALMAGSVSTGLAALENNNGPSFVMSLAYFILNGWFTLSEIIHFAKDHSLSLDIDNLKRLVGIDKSKSGD